MSTTNIINLNYTGAAQTVFLFPGVYSIECWGASGGRNLVNNNSSPGRGGYAKGTITLNTIEILHVFVGGKGADTPHAGDSAPTSVISGGFNGGGRGINGGAGGGGATDVRLGGTTLDHRIIIAGGAGGVGSNSGISSGGYGGGGAGGAGTGGGAANPGTQTSGFALGLGGDYTSTNDCGGGGGGYYGGFGGATSNSSGAGGSGFTSTTLTGRSLIGGNASMPNYNGGTVVGNLGDGYVRITGAEISFCYYALWYNNQFYIPSNELYNQQNKMYDPVSEEYLNDAVNNYDKYIYNINDLFKYCNINGEHFYSLNKFNNGNLKIVKILKRTSTVFPTVIPDIILNSINYNINVSGSHIKNYKIILKLSIINNAINYIVKIKEKIKCVKDALKYFIKSNGTNKAKFAINYNLTMFGQNFTKITEREINEKGFSLSDEKVEIDYEEIEILFGFNSLCGPTEEVKNITIYKQDEGLLKSIPKSEYEVYYDNGSKRVYVKFNNKYDKVLINSPAYSKQEVINKINEF